MTASTNFSAGTVYTSAWGNAVDAAIFDDVVNVRDYGAVGNGTTDDTAALLDAFTTALATGRLIVFPSGTYKVSGPITTGGTGSAPYTYNTNLNIHCIGDVSIVVDSSATPFQRLITVYATVPISSTKTGGALTINLNNKCACALYVRHDAASSAGTVFWGPIQVLNTFDTLATSVMETVPFAISGRFINVRVDNPIVTGVDRTDAAGFCKGISINEVDGPVLINNPVVSNVLCTGASADADGIAVFGRTISGTYNTRGGSVEIVNPVIADCQGRSIKTQITKSTIIGATINRKLVQAFITADIDHQVGGHHVIDGATFNYLKNGATPPFTAGFYPVSFQQRCIDAPGQMVLRNSLVKTESTIPYVVYITVGSTSVDGFTADALSNVSIVENVLVEGQATLKNSVCLTRCFVEFQAERVRTNANNTYLDVKFNTVNIAGLELIGYTSSTNATVSNLFASSVSNVNIGSGTGVARIAQLSGTTITSFGVDRGISNSNIT
jgi:hypothetical protein